VVVEVDWARFESEEYLADVRIRVRERNPEVFKGTKTGTRIETHLQAWFSQRASRPGVVKLI
jgi:hypothetical protein